jgi:putative endopeptidase
MPITPFTLLASLALFAGLTGSAQAASPAALPIQDILDPAAMDHSVDPCENFYQYSCGAWLRDFKIPGDRSAYWRQGAVLSDLVEVQLNHLLVDLANGKSKSDSPYAAKLAAFYGSCMDEKHAAKAALQDIRARLRGFDSPGDRKRTAVRIADLHRMGNGAFFFFYNDQDPKDSNQVIAFADRGGAGLPDRDYYLKEDSKSKEIRARYHDHIARDMELVGESTAKARSTADIVLRFETELARHSLPLDERRDKVKLYHPITLAVLKALTPAIDWDTYFQELGISAPQKLNALEPDFLKFMNQLIEGAKPEELSSYLRYKLMERSAYYAGGALQAEDFKFWDAYLHGQKEPLPRWKYCTRAVEGGMGEALGETYVASVPGADTIRGKVGKMLAEIKLSFEENLGTLAWMDASTRESARKKVAKMKQKVGWPEHWRDYSGLQIDGKSFLANEFRALEFEELRNLRKIGHPMDHTEWSMFAWEPNAYYDGASNEMVLPLGELVPPVFDSRFSDGANYGSLGAGTIGHELTHGFDDEGKDLDADGNLAPWWTPKAKEMFETKSACFIRQTEAYEILPGSGLHIRGKATLGENLADNGGVKLALIALKRAMRLPRPVTPAFQGMSELQQYFVGYAQGWCLKETNESLRNELLSDFHPPAEFRVNAVFANQPEFAEAFGCQLGAKMAPKVRCSIW